MADESPIQRARGRVSFASRLEIVPQVLRGLIALLGILGETPLDHPTEFAGQMWPQVGHERGCVLQHGRQDRDVRVARERLLPVAISKRTTPREKISER